MCRRRRAHSRRAIIRFAVAKARLKSSWRPRAASSVASAHLAELAKAWTSIREVHTLCTHVLTNSLIDIYIYIR